MAGRIPPEFIDALLSRVDIVDIVNARVPLKKAGRDFQARCPFHDEKTPSFTVSREKQFYHCFGCGNHGSAIGFLMEYDHMGFVEAVEELATLAGMEVPHDKGGHTGPDFGSLYTLLEQVKDFYRQQLRTHPQARRAVDYLKSRGLSGEIAADFGIGFAPPGWDHLIRQFAGNQHKLHLLAQSGMIAERDGRHYDRFRDRIVFPIRDQRGRTIAFGARAFDDATPKYLNSPETPVFHKGKELYGLSEARKALRQIDRLVVVEGYMDVIALAQFGIRYAVATLGTATTPDHLERLFRTAPEIIFCFDGDRAGREAAWKAMTTALPQMREAREARFLFLPEGEDPDTLIRQEGTKTFTDRVRQATPLSRFLLQKMTERVDLENLDGRARLVELIRPYLAKLPAGIFRQMMLVQLAELVGMDINLLQPQIAAKTATRTGKKEAPTTHPHMSPVRMAIALLLQYPELASRYAEPNPPWLELDVPGIPILRRLLDLLRDRPTLNKGMLLEHWRSTAEEPHLRKLINMRLPIPESGIEKEFFDSLERLTEQYRRQETNRLLAKTRHQTLSVEEKRYLQQLLSHDGQTDRERGE